VTQPKLNSSNKAKAKKILIVLYKKAATSLVIAAFFTAVKN